MRKPSARAYLLAIAPRTERFHLLSRCEIRAQERSLFVAWGRPCASRYQWRILSRCGFSEQVVGRARRRGFQRHNFLHIIALHFGDATVTVFGEKAVNDEAVDILRAGTQPQKVGAHKILSGKAFEVFLSRVIKRRRCVRKPTGKSCGVRFMKAEQRWGCRPLRRFMERKMIKPTEIKPKEDQAKEDQAKEDQAKEDQAKEDQAKEDQAKEDQAKEDQAKEDQAKEDPTRLGRLDKSEGEATARKGKSGGAADRA